MTTQQKVMALSALAELSLQVRKNGTWFILQGVEIKRGDCLEGICVAGNTPDEAIDEYWERVTNTGDGYLVKRAMHDNRFACRWNGFMWVQVREPEVTG